MVYLMDIQGIHCTVFTNCLGVSYNVVLLLSDLFGAVFFSFVNYLLVSTAPLYSCKRNSKKGRFANIRHQNTYTELSTIEMNESV